MATLLKPLKHCDQKTKSIIDGYIHKVQKLFPWQEKSYFIIPELINHLCLSFYWIRFAFNKKYIGDNLKFIDDEAVEKVEGDNHSLCAIGESISRQECKLFRIEYTIEKASTRGEFCPYIGFLMLQSIDDHVNINWNNAVGAGANVQQSIGVAIYSLHKNYVCVFKKAISPYDKVNLKDDPKFRVGDKFVLEIDFVKAESYVYYNGNKIDYVIKFDSEYIIPCLSLHFKGEAVRITKYEFVCG